VSSSVADSLSRDYDQRGTRNRSAEQDSSAVVPGTLGAVEGRADVTVGVHVELIDREP